MPGPNVHIPRWTFREQQHNHDDDDGEQQDPNHRENGSRPIRFLTQEQIQKEKLRLYQAQRNGNWLTLKNQLPLPSTKDFDLDEIGNVDWVRRRDGQKLWLLRLEYPEQRGKAKLWFILRDAYIEW